jgi:hypothetical protein
MLLNEIIFRLFALMRPLLWYYHRCGGFLRVARFRAALIQREIDQAPVLLAPDHRPQQAQPSLVLVVLVFFIFPPAASAPAGLRIRAPP